MPPFLRNSWNYILFIRDTRFESKLIRYTQTPVKINCLYVTLVLSLLLHWCHCFSITSFTIMGTKNTLLHRFELVIQNKALPLYFPLVAHQRGREKLHCNSKKESKPFSVNVRMLIKSCNRNGKSLQWVAQKL